MRKPEGLYDIGLAGLCCAGTEAWNELRGKGMIGLDITLPSTVLEQISLLDADVKALDADVQANVKRPAFISAWKAFKDEWEKFKSDNDTQFKVAQHFPGTVLTETSQHKEKLLGWREAYKRETGGVTPSGPGPVLPKPPPEERMSTSTKILLGLLAVVVIGGGGYATYKYLQTAKDQAKRGKRFIEGQVERRLTGSSGTGRLALEGG